MSIKKLKRKVKLIPLIQDCGIPYNRAASIASGRVSASESEAEAILNELQGLVNDISRVTKRGLMK